MEKIILILLLIWLLIPNEKLQPTFIEVNNDYKIFEVYFDQSINVKKLNDFDNIQILTIYPYVNPIYASKVNDLTSYSFKDKLDIDKFIDYYVKKLEAKGYKQEANKAKINGVYLFKMTVYTTETNLRQHNLNFRPIS